jgi:hypothetical protein
MSVNKQRRYNELIINLNPIIMKKLFTLLILLFFLAGSSFGQNKLASLTYAPEKKNVTQHRAEPSTPLPLGILQGGEDIPSATVIPSLPYTDIGTTSGYVDNYNEVCPYSATGGRDVVYSYTPGSDGVLDISLCNDATDYDTKLYVYDTPTPVTGDAIACNDDFCSTVSFPDAWVSELTGVPVTGGTTYYIVIDGYSSSDFGTYELSVVDGIVYPIPPNDDCLTATPVNGPFPQTVNGTTLGATVDCPGVLDWNGVWYAVTLPYALNDLTVDWCGTENMSSVGVIFYRTCPVSCNNYVLYNANTWQQCGTPPGATTALTSFDTIPGPATIYYIAYSVPQMDHVITFNVTEVTCLEPSNLVADNITTTTANLTWTPGGTEIEWEYAYGEAPFPEPAGSGTSTSSNLVNPITGLTANTSYQFYARAVCDIDQYSNWAGPSSFFTGYCIPAPSSVDGLGITNVTFSSVNNTTVAEPGNYGNYSALVGDVQQTTNVPVLITYQTGYTYDTKIWIDWNDDLDFNDPGEEVYVGTSLADNPTTLEASFDVPVTAPLGNHRMRIGGVDTGPPTPCYTGSWGSFEDYTVNVLEPPPCLAPTNLDANNITLTSAELSWNGPVDSFFDVFFYPGSEPFIGTVYWSVNSPLAINDLEPGTEYGFKVRTDCGFDTPKVDNFWLAMDAPGNLLPPLSGGSVDDPGETGIWYLYNQAPGDADWWNIWFYNDPVDTSRMKKIRMGFWIQPLDIINQGMLNYVINWSDTAWDGPGFPTPLDEAFIHRSPVNGPMPILPGAPIWVELYYIIPDYNPEWVSVDIWGENIQILQESLQPPPAGSPLFQYWLPGSPGGIIVHECLPKVGGPTSAWSEPFIFTTQCPVFNLPLCESFDGPDPVRPFCWSEQLEGLITSPHWLVNASNLAGGSPNEALAIYSPGEGATIADNDRLISPPLNTTGMTSINLSFRQYLDDYNAGVNDVWVKVQSSSDSITWTDEWAYSAGLGVDIPPETRNLVITSNLGGTTYIAWTLSGYTFDINSWHVDDICIYESCLVNTWTGAVSNAWNNPANWSCGILPNNITTVVIPTGLTVYPTVPTGINAQCFDIEVGAGATITVETGGTLNVVNP